MEEKDFSLPKATIAKMIKDILPPEIRCANDTREIISDCCIEFIQLVANEANDLCAKENKKTVTPQNILDSLKKLGFERYLTEIEELNDELKVESQKQTKSKKLKDTGLTEDELREEQEKLFAQARSNHSYLKTPTTPTSAPEGSVFTLPPSPSVNNEFTFGGSNQPKKVTLKKK
jgi:histone H3/H4